MADHSLPTTTNLYADVLTYIDARLDDLSRWNSTAYTTPTNLITGATRWNATTFKWDTWNGTDWNTPLTTRLDITAFNGSIGATTPSTGAFTTLSSSSTTALAAGTTIGGVAAVTTTGTQTLTNKTLSTGSIWNGNVIPVLYGGTGSSTSAGAPFALKGANTDLTTMSAIASFGNTSTTHVRVSTTGLVGINTVADAGTRLHIKDTSSIIKSEGTAGYGSFYATASTGQPSYMFFGTAGVETGRIAVTSAGIVTINNGSGATERLRIDAAGLVGIGAASSGGILEATKNQNASTIVAFKNSDTGASSAVILQLASGSKYTNLTNNYTGNYFAIQGQGGITTKYEDFNTHFWRDNAGNTRMYLNSLGALWIGTIAPGAVQIANFNNITGATAAFGFASNNIIQSDVTSGAYVFNTHISTQATTFTLASLVHYRANQNTIGAGSTVTNQYGFLAESTLIGGSNNFGFYGNIAAGGGRWNLYMGGTADNYMAGKLGVGIVPGSYILNVSNSTSALVGRFANSQAAGSAEIYVASNDRAIVVGQRSSTHASGDLGYIYSATNTPIGIYTNGISRLVVQAAGHTVPGANNSYTLGASGLLWSNVYATLFTGPVTALKSATTSVDVSAAAAPTAGQVLTATNGTTASWQTAGLGSYFQSADQTVTTYSLLTVAHGLGSKPRVFIGILKCTIAELGYSVGDEVEIIRTVPGVSYIQLFADGTNVYLKYDGGNLAIYNKTGTPFANITSANWKFVIRAWL